MKYYIIAGEASGDLHGSNLIKAIKEKDADANIRCWGGDLMEAAGGQLVKHYRELAFMGFWEVITNLRTILKNIDFCKKDIEAFAPDVLILIDYPGFNLRIAEWAKPTGYKVVYYISPQIWAWKEKRVHKIKRSVDKMIVILPFEEAFYDKYNYKVDYVGHPLISVVKKYQASPPAAPLADRKIIALLPGSRKQEINIKLPIMLEMTKYFPDYEFIIAQAPGLPDDFINRFTQAYPHVSSVQNQTYELLRQSTAALVTSGTATLETALFGVPQVVCYKGGAISYFFAKYLVKVKYISLVNLIMDKEVVKELIQNDLNEENLRQELQKILQNDKAIQQIKNDYQALWHKLDEEGASEKAADIIYRYLKS